MLNSASYSVFRSESAITCIGISGKQRFKSATVVMRFGVARKKILVSCNSGMHSSSYFAILDKIETSLNRVDRKLSVDMFRGEMKYTDICARSDVSLAEFVHGLHREWSDILSSLKGVDCPLVAKLRSGAYQSRALDVDTVESRIRELSDTDVKALVAEVSNIEVKQLAKNTTPADAKAIALRAVRKQTVAEMLPVLLRNKISRTLDDGPMIVTDMVRYLREVGNCRAVDISAEMLQLYTDKYVRNMSPTAVKESLPVVLEQIEQTINALTLVGEHENTIRIRLSFGVRRHLEELIPDSMGKFKEFVVKIISDYYEKVHPIVAAHMLCGITRSFTKELPTEVGGLASLFYRQTLLNSGPMILKLLQMVNAALDTATKRKYGLLTLRYPIIPRDTMDEIMQNILLQPHYCERIVDFSASVGHVRKYKWTNYLPQDEREATFMIKVIKPVTSALTACWEYELLSRIFPRGSDEDNNVRAMLVSNGEELDLTQEAKYMKEGHKKYTCTYAKVFKVDLDMTLTTIREIPGILRSGVWQGIAMEVAKGMSVASILEEPKYLARGQFEAALHRGMDLLVNRWIFTIINDGMYHGDLHAGNIFFSFEDRVMTIIDWGAVGVIDVFARSKALNLLRHIVIYAIWDNFAAIMNDITAYLNDSGFPKIDKKSDEYDELQRELKSWQLKNIKLSRQSVSASDQYTDIFGPRRIDSEKHSTCKRSAVRTSSKEKMNIYSYYDVKHDTQCEMRAPNVEMPVLWGVEQTNNDEEESMDLSAALNKLFQFYTTQNINLQSRFPELVTFQKAYALLVGVMKQINYNPFRFKTAVEKAALSWQHLPRLINIDVILRMAALFMSEKKLYNESSSG